MQRFSYSPAEVAARLGISRALVYRLIAAGRLRAVKLGARTVIPAAELERLLSEDSASAAQGGAR